MSYSLGSSTVDYDQSYIVNSLLQNNDNYLLTANTFISDYRGTKKSYCVRIQLAVLIVQGMAFLLRRAMKAIERTDNNSINDIDKNLV